MKGDGVKAQSSEYYLFVVKMGCLIILDSFRCLNAGLDELSSKITSFPISVANGMKGELFKKKLDYPRGKVYTNESFDEPLNLEKNSIPCKTIIYR